MEFNTINKNEEFWKMYGFKTGFGIRIQYTNCGKDEKVTSRTYVCFKQGQKQEDNRRVNAKPRADRRCNCCVFMRVALLKETEKYYAKEFVEEHNHDLEDRDTIHNRRAHKDINKGQAHVIAIARRAGIKPIMIHRLMALEAGGAENLSFNKNQLNAHLNNSVKTKKLGLGEASVILDYFHEKCKQNPSFFHTYQLDSEGKISNVFWVNPTMLAANDVFGDMVSFDTTFGTNNESRFLGVFSGFNHHRQIVVLKYGS